MAVNVCEVSGGVILEAILEGSTRCLQAGTPGGPQHQHEVSPPLLASMCQSSGAVETLADCHYIGQTTRRPTTRLQEKCCPSPRTNLRRNCHWCCVSMSTTEFLTVPLLQLSSLSLSQAYLRCKNVFRILCCKVNIL